MKGGKQTKKKLIGIIVCMLLLLPMLSSAEASNLNDDVEIVISAGFFGKDIGLGVTIDMVNNKNVSVTVFVNLSFDFLFLDFRDTNTSWVQTIESKCWLHFGFGYRISLFSITVEGGNTTVTRDGIIIYKLLILFK